MHTYAVGVAHISPLWRGVRGDGRVLAVAGGSRVGDFVFGVFGGFGGYLSVGVIW